MFTALTDEDENAVGTHQTKYTYCLSRYMFSRFFAENRSKTIIGKQLNRIKSMTGYNRTVTQAASASGYSSSYTFDENGNLETLKRNAWNASTATSVLMEEQALLVKTERLQTLERRK